MFLVLYVDNILLIGNDIPILQNVKSWLGNCFSMKDLGETAYILGIKCHTSSHVARDGRLKPIIQ